MRVEGKPELTISYLNRSYIPIEQTIHVGRVITLNCACAQDAHLSLKFRICGALF